MVSLGVILSGSACAPRTDTVAETGAPIIGGTLDTGDPAVVEFDQGCTAELVSPRVLLTAAHCVTGASPNPSIFTGPDDQQTTGGVTVPVKEMHAHPAYNPNVPESPHDVAVLILQNPLNIPPIHINRKPLDATLVGKPVRIVGYGTIKTPNGPGDGFGKRRQATSPLVSFNQNWVNVGSSTANQCFGDSGGPALMLIDGKEVIVGVDSFGSDSGPTCLMYNGDTRIDQELGFIDQYLPPDPVGGTDGGASGADGGTAPGQPGSMAPGEDGGTAPGSDPQPHAPGQLDPMHAGGGCAVAGSDGNASALMLVVAMLLLWQRRRHNSVA